MGVMDPSTQLEFERHLEVAHAHANAARKQQVQFWAELAESVPDLDKLFDIGSEVHTSTRQAESHFHKCIEMNPNSTTVLRAYAAFVLDVLSDKAHVRSCV